MYLLIGRVYRILVVFGYVVLFVFAIQQFDNWNVNSESHDWTDYFDIIIGSVLLVFILYRFLKFISRNYVRQKNKN